jgi:hypothetical protein
VIVKWVVQADDKMDVVLLKVLVEKVARDKSIRLPSLEQLILRETLAYVEDVCERVRELLLRRSS